MKEGNDDLGSKKRALEEAMGDTLGLNLVKFFKVPA